MRAMRTKRTQTRQEEIASGTCVVSPKPPIPPIDITATASGSSIIAGSSANLRNKPTATTMLKRPTTTAGRESSTAKSLRKTTTTTTAAASVIPIDNKSDTSSTTVTNAVPASESDKKMVPPPSTDQNVKDTIADKKKVKKKLPVSEKAPMAKVKKLTKKDILKNKQIAAAAAAGSLMAATTATAASDDKPPTSPMTKDERVSKELKNLDIQISGFSSVLKCDSNASSSDIIIKASISEIVKTKSRTTASQSIYGKSATMTATPSFSNISGTSIGTNANSDKPVKPVSDAKDAVEVKLDDHKGDSEASKALGIGKKSKVATKKGGRGKKETVAKSKLLAKKKLAEEGRLASESLIKNLVGDEADKETSSSTKKRNTDKPLGKNKKFKITDPPPKTVISEPNDGLKSMESKFVAPVTVADLHEVEGLMVDEPQKEGEVTIDDSQVVKGKKRAKQKPKKGEAVKSDLSEAAKKPNVSKKVKMPPKADLEKEKDVSKTDEPVVDQATTSSENTAKKLIKTPPKKKPVKAKKGKNPDKVGSPEKPIEIEAISVAPTLEAAASVSSVTIPADLTPPTDLPDVTTGFLQPTTESPSSSPKHQKCTKASTGKELATKKPAKVLSIDESALCKAKTKIACPKKKILKALKITEEQNKTETTAVDAEPIDCDEEPIGMASIESKPIESPSIMELTEDTSSMPQTDMLATLSTIPASQHVSSGQLSDLIMKPDKSPKRSQSNIKKMVEDILQVLEMSDEFSGNEAIEMKTISVPDEILPTPTPSTLTELCQTTKNVKPVAKPKVAKVTKPRAKKPEKVEISTVEPSLEASAEPRKEEASSDEPLSALIKTDLKPTITSGDSFAQGAPKVVKKLLKKSTPKKIATPAGTSQIVKRKYVRKKPKSTTALQKLVETAVKKKKKLTLTEAEISALDCADEMSRTKDVYDFHESGHSSEDTSPSYKKNVKKDPKQFEPKEDTDPSDPLAFAEAVAIESSIFVKKENEPSTDEDDKCNAKPPKDNKSKKPPKECVTKPKKPKETKPAKARPKKAATKKKYVSTKGIKTKKPAAKQSESSSSEESEPMPTAKKKPDKEPPKKKASKSAPAKNKKKKKVVAKKSRSRYTSNESDSEDDDDSSDGDEVLAKKYYKSKRLTTSTSNTTESDSESGTSVRTRVNKRRKAAVKNRRMRLFGFYSGPKRHRMASLNALAKVQCLYENESRTAQELGFVREPRVIPAKPRPPPVVIVTNDDGASSSENESADQDSGETSAAPVSATKKKGTAAKDPLSEEPEVKLESEVIGSRSLRMAPGIRGAGKLWEMGNMSSMESNTCAESDESYDQVSVFLRNDV